MGASKPIDILVIEDSDDDYALIEQALRRGQVHCRCHRVWERATLNEALATKDWDLVLSDYSVPGLYFPQVLGQIMKSSPTLPVILVSGTLGEVKAIAMIKLGARDYVCKDRLSDLIPTIERHVDVSAAEKVRAGEVL